MRIGYAVVILLFALAMTAGAGPAFDRARSESFVSGEGVMADVKDSDFVFVYSSRGGANVAKDMQMWEASLTVDSRSGLATLELNRDHGDDAGQSIGRFEMPVGIATLERVRAQLESSNFVDLKAEGKYEMLNGSLLTMTYRTAKGTVVKTVGSDEQRSLTRLEPLMTEIHNLQFGLRSRPKAALKLEIRHIVRDKKEYFELVFINDSQESVYLLSPDVRSDEREWSGVKVALYQEEERGVISGPPSWERISLLQEQRTDAGNGYVRIDPGKKHLMKSRPWKPDQCGVPYGAQGVMINYQGAGNKDGFPVIRGGLFSNVIGIVSCKDGETVMSKYQETVR